MVEEVGKIEDVDASEVQVQKRDGFETGYYRTVAELKRRIEPGQNRPVDDRAHVKAERGEGNGGSQVERVRLPILELPKFDALNIPKNIKLSDHQFGEPGEIDVLLGGRVFWNLLCVRQVKLGRSIPILQKTKLGWIMAGNASIPDDRTDQSNVALCAIVKEPDLHQQMERFWIVEKGSLRPRSSREENLCEEQFRNTHKRAAVGRFIVDLPLREKPSVLGESRATALKQLQSVCRRLDRDPILRAQYTECMEDYLRSGHMTKVDEMTESMDEPVHYLPHHAVLKDESTTTKLRVVFYASCETTTGKSLNDIMRVGPTIQQELFEIVVRFRYHQFVLTGDIPKIYRQVCINPKQRNLQRILWKPGPNSTIEEFTMHVLMFGNSASLFLAVRSLHELEYECKLSDPKISEIIQRDFYVDDLITGSDDAEELKRIKEGVSRVLLTGGFPMHKWKSNLPEVVEESERTNASAQKPLGDQVKTLGLYWDVAADSLLYRVNVAPIDKKVTKRKVLSIIAQIYDPLGLINPVVVRAKIMLQRLWQCKVGWDESLPEDLHTAWLSYYRQLKMLEEVRVPRRIVLTAPIRIEVHSFCDASD
ncbi:uncharacterized protein LOC143895349 [Temnothorax americanus]|uniref:uncharacterized protein LOC143895349 n=1 Tax=Temnothorax americanus TaxID=1964332 RepID=UPI004067C57F